MLLKRGPTKKFWLPTSRAWDTASGGGPPPVLIPTYIQGNTAFNGNTASSTVSVTLGSLIGSGHMAIVTVGYAGFTAQATSVVDDKSNVYTQVDQIVSTGFVLTTFYCLNITNAPSVIQGNMFGSPQFGAIVVDVFSNVLSSGAYDGSAILGQTSAPTTTDGITSGTITTVGNGDLIYGLTVDIGGGAVPAPGTGFTGHQTAGDAYYTEHLVQPSAAIAAGTFTTAAVGRQFITTVMAFQHA